MFSRRCLSRFLTFAAVATSPPFHATTLVLGMVATVAMAAAFGPLPGTAGDRFIGSPAVAAVTKISCLFLKHFCVVAPPNGSLP